MNPTVLHPHQGWRRFRDQGVNASRLLVVVISALVPRILRGRNHKRARKLASNLLRACHHDRCKASLMPRRRYSLLTRDSATTEATAILGSPKGGAPLRKKIEPSLGKREARGNAAGCTAPLGSGFRLRGHLPFPYVRDPRMWHHLVPQCTTLDTKRPTFTPPPDSASAVSTSPAAGSRPRPRAQPPPPHRPAPGAVARPGSPSRASRCPPGR